MSPLRRLFEALHQPVSPEMKELLSRRWRELPEQLQTPNQVLGRQLEVRGELRFGETPHPFVATLPVEEPSAVVWTGGGFVEAAGEDLDENAPGLALGWVGPPRIHDRVATDADPELERQLKALGYL